MQPVDPTLELLQSEYCILERNDEIRGGRRRDLGMETALYVARIMHCDLTIANARSWQWWTALTQCDYKDGLIYLDDGQGNSMRRPTSELNRTLMQDGAFRASKLMWTLGNYARFVRPRMVRIGCRVTPAQDLATGVLVSAYRDETTPKTVVVLVNQADTPRTVELAGGGQWRAYTTSASKDLRYQAVDGALFECEPRSVTTLTTRLD